MHYDEPFFIAFEDAITRIFGERMRSDDEFCVDMWSAITNVDWKHDKHGSDGYTFRHAASTISEICGRGHDMTWYCCGPSGVVSNEIADAMRGEGWTYELIKEAE